MREDHLRPGLILPTSCTGHVGLGNRHAESAESGTSKTGLNLAHNTVYSIQSYKYLSC